MQVEAAGQKISPAREAVRHDRHDLDVQYLDHHLVLDQRVLFEPFGRSGGGVAAGLPPDEYHDREQHEQKQQHRDEQGEDRDLALAFPLVVLLGRGDDSSAESSSRASASSSSPSAVSERGGGDVATAATVDFLGSSTIAPDVPRCSGSERTNALECCFQMEPKAYI
uniref:Uncharacterized protein n=1 Tax=Anopheles farauti TaxID=69004 RepID=A0A182QUB6_9DIPT